MSDLALGNFNRLSAPSQLKITDLRFAKISGAPMDCVLLKIYTNSELVGFGEVRDWASETYALTLKSRLLGENPCNVDKLFRKIKQFGGMSRQAGGVSGVELALWDLAGKAYGVPIYQMLGGKFRDKVRLYSDTDQGGRPDGKKMGAALKERLDLGFTFLKMDWGVGTLMGLEEGGYLTAPLGFLDELKATRGVRRLYYSDREKFNKYNEVQNIAHFFTGLQITEKGLDFLENYLAEVRSVIGYEVPLAIDHCGHIGLNECIKLGRRAEKYNIAWLEDLLPWQATEQWKKLSQAIATPLGTGEDIYLKENFLPLLESGALSIVHPDILSTGGILETKKIGDLAQNYGAAMCMHMAETPVAALASAHVATATENFLALEFHSVEVDWWDDIVKAPHKPIIKNGFIELSDAPGLGIDDLNDEVIRAHLHSTQKDIWLPTPQWDDDYSSDRTWS
ncbi:MAG: mandelate racemase/muconate lactonizing enzyme family protein [Treponema sp.]|nr:mandelate racemase/muconate lactonizing enzyme family protein [Treponema sp.]